MKKRFIAQAGIALAAGSALALGVALPASAHVGVSGTSTAAGSYTLLTFTVPHGCEGSPTVVVDIELPETILSATPERVAGWEVSKVTEPVEGATDSHGNEVSERVAHVVYTATDGGLPSDQLQQFSLSLQLPDAEAGTMVEFPVVQTCVEGTAEWVGDEVPAITLTAAVEGDGHSHGTDEAATDAHDHGTETATADSGSSDVLARVFGIAGLVLGAAGLVFAVVTRRRSAPAESTASE